MIISKGSISDGRKYVTDVVLNKKSQNSKFKVIDIGGAVNGWTKSFVDFLVDINAPDSANNLKIDICVESEWTKLKSIVEQHGKFDYCVCTHTLEDLYNPLTALKYMPEIAHSGIITMPDAKTELSHVESSKWLGYIHHRWIFDHEADNMLIIPKLNFLEAIVTQPFDKQTNEIRFEWDNKIDHKLFMNNYLGPTVNHVVSQYQQFITTL
jgi:hypothetical protein